MKKGTLITITLLLAMSAFAQPSKFSGALLWKISGNGLNAPSYIIGTHHLISTDFIQEIPGFNEALSSAEQIVGELDMQNISQMQEKMMQAAIMPSEYQYNQMLSKEDYQILDAELKKTFMAGLDQLGSFKPGMISTMFVTTLYSKAFPGFNQMTHVGIDVYVQNYAKENNKKILGLEELEDQIYVLFDSAPMKDQAENLACMVKNTDKSIENLRAMTEIYKMKDLNGLYKLSFEDKDDPCPMSDDYNRKINKDRNDKWLKKLPAIMKDGSSFIAVGALHISGEEGLLHQLSLLGYSVEPVL